ncbi:hypothetical protein [Desulfosporosinus sp. SB140]|uniref:hypothetical protein n=1 Tax=Desulfosporosinus paludis TaxID=3115649 RepID=UPI00388FCFF7
MQTIALEEGESKLLSNLKIEIVQDEGGTHILAYEIMVFLGSIPFIAFMIWRAAIWGLTKRSAFFIGLFLCGDVMVFPRALQSGRVSWWLISIAILIIAGASWPSIMKVMINHKKYSQTDNYAETKNNQHIAEQIKSNLINSEIIDNVIETEIVDLESTGALESPEMIDKAELNMLDNAELQTIDRFEELHMIAENEELASSVFEDSSDVLSLDELLELGFNEKYSENFAQAATYFMRALALEPGPDMAFYLILDCHWLWKNIGETNDALPRIMVYAKKYFPQFSADLQRQFEVWLMKEDLDKYFK